jgi:hypothetical protein
MNRTATAHRRATLAALGGLMLALFMHDHSAKAQTACMNGLPISTIVSTSGGYTCQSGTLVYTFYDTIADLNLPDQNGFVTFVASPTTQQITFENLSFQGLTSFNYDITSASDTVTFIEQTWTQDLPFPPPISSEVFASLPSSIVTVIAELETDQSFGPPFDPRLTSLTHTITKVPIPGPLPVVGTALALGFSRSYRNRIRQANSKGQPGRPA